MSIKSTIYGVSDRSYNNAAKAFLRDPRRPIRVLDFLTLRERQVLLFTSLGDMAYEAYLDRRMQDV